MPGRTLTVRDLAAQLELGLRVVVEGDLDKPVRGAHTMEIEGASRWLEPGWLMLTTGMRFAGVADTSSAQWALVDELVDREVAALLFGIGVHFERVPQALVEAATSCGLTLLTIAPDVPFLQVEQFVSRSMLSTDVSALTQSLWLQNDLLETLSGDQPVRALVYRLGTLINGTAVLYEDSGRVVASTGTGPTMLIWSEIHTRPAADLRFLVGRWHVVARPLTLRGTGYWIALASRREQVLDELGDPVLGATERLLGAIRGVRALSAAQAQAEATQILRTVWSGLTPGAAHRTWERLKPFRIEPEHPLRAFVTHPFTPSFPTDGHTDDPADAALSLARELSLPLVMDTDPETHDVAGLVGDSSRLDEWAQQLAEHYHLGMSEPFTDLREATERRRDAERALRVARRRAEYSTAARAGAVHGAILKFEHADVINWLLSNRDQAAFADKIHQQFVKLMERTELLDTIVIYLETEMDINATAERLYMHPNSVRYRLRRIEEMIQAPLQSPAVIANLYVAFHDRISETPE